MGSSNSKPQLKFFRGADLGEFMALAFGEFAELPDCVGICDVFAIPCQKIFRVLSPTTAVSDPDAPQR